MTARELQYEVATAATGDSSSISSHSGRLEGGTSGSNASSCTAAAIRDSSSSSSSGNGSHNNMPGAGTGGSDAVSYAAQRSSSHSSHDTRQGGGTSGGDGSSCVAAASSVSGATSIENDRQVDTMLLLLDTGEYSHTAVCIKFQQSVMYQTCRQLYV